MKDHSPPPLIFNFHRPIITLFHPLVHQGWHLGHLPKCIPNLFNFSHVVDQTTIPRSWHDGESILNIWSTTTQIFAELCANKGPSPLLRCSLTKMMARKGLSYWPWHHEYYYHRDLRQFRKPLTQLYQYNWVSNGQLSSHFHHLQAYLHALDQL